MNAANRKHCWRIETRLTTYIASDLFENTHSKHIEVTVAKLKVGFSINFAMDAGFSDKINYIHQISTSVGVEHGAHANIAYSKDPQLYIQMNQYWRAGGFKVDPSIVLKQTRSRSVIPSDKVSISWIQHKLISQNRMTKAKSPVSIKKWPKDARVN